MPTIAVYVSDDLYQKIRHEVEVNHRKLSQVIQAALEKELQAGKDE